MNDLLSKVAEVDPDFARSLRRNQVISYVFALVAVLAIGGAAWAVGVNFKQDTSITRVERNSACEVDAYGEECQQLRREAAQAANIATTCIPFWKAGYPCPKPGSPAAEQRVGRAAPAAAGETDATSRLDAPSVPDQFPGQVGGVGPGEDEGGRPPKAPVPTNGNAQVQAPASDSSRVEVTERPAPEDPAPVLPAPAPLLPSTVEAVAGQVVGEAGSEVLCSVRGLLKPCGP